LHKKARQATRANEYFIVNVTVCQLPVRVAQKYFYIAPYFSV
jgi:hypothetical protein